jgi:ABC-type transporter MlaC component
MSIFTRIILGTAISLPFVANGAEPDAYAKFVGELKDRAMALYEPGVTEGARLSGICKLVTQYVDYQNVADTTISSVRSEVSTERLEPFYVAFRSMLANLFTKAFSELQDAEVVVEPTSKIVSSLHVVTVHVENRRGRSDRRIQFFVNDEPKLVDVSMSGMLLSRAKRAEYESFLARLDEPDANRKLQALTADISSRVEACP